MAPKAFFLNEADKEALQEFLSDWQQRNAGYSGRPPDMTIDREEFLAPEVYVALTPEDGIPALDRATSGTSDTSLSDDVPGSAECPLYSVEIDEEGSATLSPYTDLIKDIYNLSGSLIPGDTWVLAIRDKAGSWFAMPVGGIVLGCRYIKVVDKICLVTITEEGDDDDDTTGTGTGGANSWTAGCDGERLGASATTYEGSNNWGTASTALTCEGVFCGIGFSNDPPLSGTLEILFDFDTFSLFPFPEVDPTGIEVRCRVYTNPATPSQTITLTAHLCLNGLVVSGPRAASVSGFPPYDLILGGEIDSWDRAWTQAEIRDPTFGVIFTASTTTICSDTMGIDCVGMTVCWETSETSGLAGLPGIPGAGTGTSSTSRTAIKTMYQLIDLTKSCSDPDRVVSEWCEIEEEDCCDADTTGTGTIPDDIPGETGYSGPCGQCEESLPFRLLLSFGSHNLPLFLNAGYDPGGFEIPLDRVQVLGEIVPTIKGCPSTGPFDPCSLWTDETNAEESSAYGTMPIPFKFIVGFSGSSSSGNTSYRDWAFSVNQISIPPYSFYQWYSDGGQPGSSYPLAVNCAQTFVGFNDIQHLSATQEQSTADYPSCGGPVLAHWDNVKVYDYMFGSPTFGQEFTISSVKIVRVS